MKALTVALISSHLSSSFETTIFIPPSTKVPYPPVSFRIFVVLPLVDLHLQLPVLSPMLCWFRTHVPRRRSVVRDHLRFSRSR